MRRDAGSQLGGGLLGGEACLGLGLAGGTALGKALLRLSKGRVAAHLGVMNERGGKLVSPLAGTFGEGSGQRLALMSSLKGWRMAGLTGRLRGSCRSKGLAELMPRFTIRRFRGRMVGADPCIHMPNCLLTAAMTAERRCFLGLLYSRYSSRVSQEKKLF